MADTLTAPIAQPPPPPPAPPTPPPAPKPEPVTAEGGTLDFDQLDAKWDAHINKPKAPEEPKAEEPTETPPEPAKEPEAKPEPKAKEERTIAPKQLRENLLKAQAELKAAKDAQAAMEKRIADAEAKGKDTTILAEKLAAREKELEEARASLRAAKQEMDPEFVEKYEKPFNQEAEYVKREIEQLFVMNAETGEPERQATWEDFTQFYSMPRGKAIAQIKQMFGDASGIVLSHLSALQRLDMVRQTALKEEKAKWAERTKNEEANRIQQREAFEQASARVDGELKAKHPEWYAEDPNDADGNAILKEGYALVDAKPRTLQEAVILRANIRARAAAFGRIAMQRAALAKENAELKKTIEEMKSAKPGPTKRPAGTEPAPEKSFADDLRDSMRD